LLICEEPGFTQRRKGGAKSQGATFLLRLCVKPSYKI